MTRITALLLPLLSLVLLAPPAFCQQADSYQDFHLQAPGFDPSEVNCAVQPTNQYYNPVQQPQSQQFNQMVSPTQVPQDYQSAGLWQGQQQPQQNYAMQGQNSSAYQQQEMALQQTEMAQQLEEVKQSRESGESFRMGSEFNDKGASEIGSGAKKIKGKGIAGSMGRIVKNGMRYATPAAGTVASVYILRAAFGGGMVAMPLPMGGGGMMIVPGR